MLACTVAANRSPFQTTNKLAEGLFLSAWTHWEEFLRKLFTEDLASLPKSALRHEVKQFRTKNAPARLAEIMLGHPDEYKWIEWSDFNAVMNRAATFLGAGSRFQTVTAAPAGGPLALDENDLAKMKRIRNAIAHKSDYAWESFRKLAQAAPFSLTRSQMKGITVGRFLISHKWDSKPVLQESLARLQTNGQVLVT